MDKPTEAALREFLFAFADDEHLMGQQHTEWIGVAPFLEEDLAFSSIGQDELGHAVMLYELVCELDGVEPTDAAIDALAYGRGAAEYRSCSLVEYTTTNWAEALVRHWIYDTLEAMRWSLVAESTYQPLAELSARVAGEERYHLRHADALLDGLMADPAARAKCHEALDELQADVLRVCPEAGDERELVKAGILSEFHHTLMDPLRGAIEARFDWSFGPIDLVAYSRGSKRSEHFGPLMARMREVLDLDPSAAW